MADERNSERTLDERVRDVTLVTEALRRAVRDALQRHKRAGNPVAVWRNGRTVWIEPEDIPTQEEFDAAR